MEKDSKRRHGDRITELEPANADLTRPRPSPQLVVPEGSEPAPPLSAVALNRAIPSGNETYARDWIELRGEGVEGQAQAIVERHQVYGAVSTGQGGTRLLLRDGREITVADLPNEILAKLRA